MCRIQRDEDFNADEKTVHCEKEIKGGYSSIEGKAAHHGDEDFTSSYQDFPKWNEHSAVQLNHTQPAVCHRHSGILPTTCEGTHQPVPGWTTSTTRNHGALKNEDTLWTNVLESNDRLQAAKIPLCTLHAWRFCCSLSNRNCR